MIYEIDKSILIFIKDYIRNDTLTPIMRFITTLGNAGLIWIAITIFLILYKPTRKVGVIAMAALVSEFLVCNVILKNIVRRTRPYVRIKELSPLVKRPTDFSFPSGHASSSFAVGFTIFRKCDKRAGIPAFLLAVLIAFSRLYVAVHYPSDVIVGAVIGMVFSHVGEWMVEILHKRFENREQENHEENDG